MSKRSFVNSDGWQKIYNAVTEQVEARREAALTATDFASKEYERGWVDSLRAILLLPEELLVDEESNEKESQENEVQAEVNEKEEGVIRIAGRRPRRTGFFR